jgi:midasin (ATPase involved in ribosome maturation)
MPQKKQVKVWKRGSEQSATVYPSLTKAVHKLNLAQHRVNGKQGERLLSNAGYLFEYVSGSENSVTASQSASQSETQETQETQTQNSNSMGNGKQSQIFSEIESVFAEKERLKQENENLRLQLEQEQQQGPRESASEAQPGEHSQVSQLRDFLSKNIPVMMVGPAGSGKTSAAKKVAQDLESKFHSMSLSGQTSEIKLAGYKDAAGSYHRTSFREAFENGGVFLLDEVDNGNPNILTVLNSAVDNGFFSFPDKEVEKHSDFRIVTTANTYGSGGSRDYVGRNPLDGAFLDRFLTLDWEYDQELEFNIAPDKEWCKHVQNIRKVVNDLSVRLIVSPRATLNGGKLTDMYSFEQLEDWLIFKGASNDIKTKVKRKL